MEENVMAEEPIAAQQRETNASETHIISEDKRDFRGASEEVRPIAPTRGQTVWPRWPGILCGRLILRICASGKKADVCDGCRLRVFCRCAQDEFEKATVLERRLWVALAVCGAGVVLYCLL